MAKKLDLIKFCVKIFEKCPEAKKNKNWYFQQGGKLQWCQGFPVWLKRVDKQEAKELKRILQDLPSQQPKHNRWLPADQQIDQDGKLDQSKCKFIGAGSDGNTPNPELIQELDKIISQGGDNKLKLKLTGCQCSDKDKEFEVDLKGETYDENKDLIACFQCWDQDEYSQLVQKKFDSYEVGTNRQVAIAIIKDALDKPTTEKCADCQIEKKPNELTTIQENGKDIKICSDCKTKRDNNTKPCAKCKGIIDKLKDWETKAKSELTKQCSGDCAEAPKSTYIDTDDKCECGINKLKKNNFDDKENKCETCLNKNPNEDDGKEPTPQQHNQKIWGSDFGQLKPLQRTGRIATNSSYKKFCENEKSRISLLCPYCCQKFDFDKKIKNYLPAKEEVEGRWNTHKSSCSLKNDKSKQKTEAQKSWDAKRADIKKTGKGCHYRECDKCWGEIRWDINIESAEPAKQQCMADLKAHKKECHKPEGERKIAVYHSPNKGGNEHANINDYTYEDMDDLPFKDDNLKEVSQQQTSSNDKKPISWAPWIIIGGVIFVGVLLAVILYRKFSKN